MMGVFGGRRAVKVEAVAEWIPVWFFDHEAPKEGEAGYHDYVTMRYFSGHDGERDLWLQYEAELLARWVAQHPGTRPWAWWWFSAPEGRGQTSGAPIERGALHDQVDEEGLPLALYDFAHGLVAFESEAACLKRLNLLGEGEAARVRRSQYRPLTFEARVEDEPAA